MRKMNLLLILYLLCTGAYAQEFTIDIASPECQSQVDPGDILYSNGANIRFTHNNLGLILKSNEVDGFSYGKDRIYAPESNYWIKLFYSVDRNSEGKPGGVVDDEANNSGASGDKFAVEMWNSVSTKTPPWLLSTATDHGLTENSIKNSDLDGMTYSTPDGVYFSVDPTTAGQLKCKPGDILYQDNPSTSPSALSIYAEASDLGLNALDDINALAVLDLGVKGVLDSGDEIYISLKTGSPSVNTWGAATVLKAYPGSLEKIYDSDQLDLDEDDDLNALGGRRYEVIPPPYTEASLCIHNGGEFFVNGPFHGFPNEGAGKYFPSFTHWTPTMGDNGAWYPWKLRGYCWAGCQGFNGGPTWYWESCLQASEDNPRNPMMSWDYPMLYQNGTVSYSGAPNPIYGGPVPTTVPLPGYNQFIYPSSLGGMDSYLNIFLTFNASWNIPSTKPFYSWKFGFEIPCASAITAPSSCSIWEFVWSMKGPNDQYVSLSGDETDCEGNPGNKGRNYSLVCDVDNNRFWYWTNNGQGSDEEWAMCLFVCDAVTIPVNAPGASNSANPFASYGFDVGVATITPNLSSGNLSLGFTTEDGLDIGGARIVLAALGYGTCIGPYGNSGFRVPHDWDVVTNLFLGVANMFMHTPSNNYPSCMIGTTIGAHTNLLPVSDLSLLGAELRFSTFASNPYAPMSASYMATYF